MQVRVLIKDISMARNDTFIPRSNYGFILLDKSLRSKACVWTKCNFYSKDEIKKIRFDDTLNFDCTLFRNSNKNRSKSKSSNGISTHSRINSGGGGGRGDDVNKEFNDKTLCLHLRQLSLLEECTLCYEIMYRDIGRVDLDMSSILRDPRCRNGEMGPLMSMPIRDQSGSVEGSVRLSVGYTFKDDSLVDLSLFQSVRNKLFGMVSWSTKMSLLRPPSFIMSSQSVDALDALEALEAASRPSPCSTVNLNEDDPYMY